MPRRSLADIRFREPVTHQRIRVRRAGERLWHSRYRHDTSIDRMRFDAASVHFDTNGAATVEYAQAAF